MEDGLQLSTDGKVPRGLSLRAQENGLDGCYHTRNLMIYDVAIVLL